MSLKSSSRSMTSPWHVCCLWLVVCGAIPSSHEPQTTDNAQHPDSQYWQGHSPSLLNLRTPELLEERHPLCWIFVHKYLCCICLRHGLPAADEKLGLQGAKECPAGWYRSWPRRSGESLSMK